MPASIEVQSSTTIYECYKMELYNSNDNLKLLAFPWDGTGSKTLQGSKEEIEGHSDTAKHCCISCHCAVRCCTDIWMNRSAWRVRS